MRATLGELLTVATRRRAAVGAFTCYNLETAAGVLEAADRQAAGVVLLISAAALRAPGGSLLLAAGSCAAAPACVQLDHATDLDQIELALAAGAGAVMADGSRLSLEANIEFVRRVVVLARRYGGEIEAEPGRIEGDEELDVRAAAGAMTDPLEATRLIEQSEADCLANCKSFLGSSAVMLQLASRVVPFDAAKGRAAVARWTWQPSGAHAAPERGPRRWRPTGLRTPSPKRVEDDQ